MSWRLAADHPDNEWILGCQIIQFQWDVPEMPTAAMIDEYISDRPVFLQQVDLHTFSANTCAINKVGVTSQTPDPAGGKILKDADGNLTGVFSNNAGAFFMDEVYDPAPEVVDASFAKTARRANALGITTVGMVNPTFVSMENPYAVLAGLNAKGDLAAARVPVHRPVRKRVLDARADQGEIRLPGYAGGVARL